ncbi:MAG: vWA domain-containing protein, partial [Vibrio fluvialis]
FATIGAASAQADGTIVAMKGGDRSSSNSVTGSTNYAAPLSGALFEYTTGNPTSSGTTWTAFPSVPNAAGQAQVTVPNGIYYVRERSPGADFSDFGPVQELSYSGNQPYVARVNVQNNQTSYAFPHYNTSGNPANWNPTNSGSASNNGSPFINVRNNGSLPPSCGLNVLLVLDRSGSIYNYRNTYRNAALEFISKLNGTPTQVGIASFSNSVNSYQPAQGNSSMYQSPLSLANPGSASTLNGVINNIYNSPSGSTNWDGALQAAAASKSFTPNPGPGQTANPDLVVFITDGNPTSSEANTNSSNDDLIELTAGMASANLVKNQASRPGQKVKLLAIGVGTGVTADNLRVVSGPDEGVDQDYAVPTIPELGAFLTELAATQCGARVYVRKLVQGQSGNQAGWYFTATDPRPGQSPTYLDDNRATHSSGVPPVI